MKVKTIERFFLIVFTPLLLIGLHILLAGIYRSLYYEQNPFKGSLHGELMLMFGYAAFMGVVIVLGTMALLAFGIKPEPATVTAVTDMSPARKKWYSLERLFFITAGILLLIAAVYNMTCVFGYAWIGYTLFGIACLAYQRSIKEKE